MSTLEGDREAVMKTLGDTIRALDAPDQWRILAAVLNALEKGGVSVWLTEDGIVSGDSTVEWSRTAHQWQYVS